MKSLDAMYTIDRTLIEAGVAKVDADWFTTSMDPPKCSTPSQDIIPISHENLFCLDIEILSSTEMQ